MALRTRGDIMPYTNGIEPTYHKGITHFIGYHRVFGAAEQGDCRRKCFAHASGIHQDGMLKNAETYEIMTPESVGLNESKLVMSKHSGRHAFREKLKELAMSLVITR